MALLSIALWSLSGASSEGQVPLDRYRSLLQTAADDTSAGCFLAARAALEQAIALEPSRFEAWTQLGLLYDQVDDFKNAERALRRSLQLDPERAQTHFLLGRTLIANPREGLDWPAAITEFREVIRIDAKDTEAMDRLGVGLLSTGKKEEAIAVLERAVALSPGKALQQFDLGLALESNDDLTGAIAHYRLALKTREDYAEAASALGKALFAQNKLDESETWLRTALGLNPDLQDAHQALGRVLRKLGKLLQAQHEFEEAAALDRRSQDVAESTRLSNGALAKAAKGDFPGAEEDLRTAVRLRPDSGIPHFNLGLILADRQQLTAAAEQLSVAISLMPARVQPWISLAKVQSELGQTEAARRSITLALQLAPADANAQRESRKLEVKPLDSAHSPDPIASLPFAALTIDTVESHQDIAEQLEKEGNWQDAGGQWRRVLQFTPGAARPRLHLAHCLERIGDLAGAILEGRKALLVSPKSSPAHVALAASLLAAGEKVEARAVLAEALRLDPASAPALAMLSAIPAA